MKHTPFYQKHLDNNAKMIDFGGWEMPIHYGSQIQEHHQVRQDAGMFDVSHMVIIDLKGEDTLKYLKRLLANDIGKISSLPGKAIYSCILKEDGCVIDDLIVYALEPEWFRIVSNASTKEKDVAWMRSQIKDDTVNLSVRDDICMLAVQGPKAIEKSLPVINKRLEGCDTLKPFFATYNDAFFVGRTGYTGENGFEILFDKDLAHTIWDELIDQGIKPIGLGARDTLRLEAGMNLYGNDMDETVTPLVSGLSWTVDFKDESRQFIGRDALEKQKQAGINDKLVGLILQDKGIIRTGQKVLVGEKEGIVTSGGFSPTLEKSIAMARIPVSDASVCQIEIRKKQLDAQIVKMPFVRNGKALK